MLVFNWFELHEGITVVLHLPDHVLLEEQIVSGRKMIVLVILD